MEKQPTISVLMGVRYSREDTLHLERAVQSILKQTYQNLELLICDDGSTETARSWLEKMAAQEARIRLIRDAGCLDLAKKLNLCLKSAQGEYIARMDDDDYSYPDRLEKQIRFLIDHPGASFVGCNVNLVQNKVIIGERKFPPWPGVEDFYFVQPYIHPTLLFQREALLAVGGYSEQLNCVLCEDYDLLLRLYKAGFKGANLQEILLDYTVPLNAKGNRKWKHRWNETVTRWKRFQELGKLPGALPYVIKPIAVGLIPEGALARLKAVMRKN